MANPFDTLKELAECFGIIENKIYKLNIIIA
jgi:hypothetical protein